MSLCWLLWLERKWFSLRQPHLKILRLKYWLCISNLFLPNTIHFTWSSLTPGHFGGWRHKQLGTEHVSGHIVTCLHYLQSTRYMKNGVKIIKVTLKQTREGICRSTRSLAQKHYGSWQPPAPRDSCTSRQKRARVSWGCSPLPIPSRDLTRRWPLSYMEGKEQRRICHLVGEILENLQW